MNGGDTPITTAARSLEDFMGQALAMEQEAAARYTLFADAMQAHNAEIAAMFSKMAFYEGEHAKEIMQRMGWTEAPPEPEDGYGWPALEAPETAPFDEAHYLMGPWHMLQLALAAEKRAEAFFGHLAAQTADDEVRKAALELQAEEREHVELVLAWLAKVPEPEAGWDHDPDPPRSID